MPTALRRIAWRTEEALGKLATEEGVASIAICGTRHLRATITCMHRVAEVLTACSVLAASIPAAAMSTRVADLSALTRRADLIVVGQALERQSYWHEGRIYTSITVSTDEVWSGTPEAATIEVVTLGGVVDGIAQQVEGAPVFTVGERLVLVLAREQPGRYFPLGLWQGVFRVTTEGSDAWVRRDVTPALAIGGRAAAPLLLSLQALRALVHEAAGAQN